MDTDQMIMAALGGTCCLSLVGAVVMIIIGTFTKAHFGVNLGAANCSDCGKKAPAIRHPQDLYEILWGGWTCERCGQKNDKWGNPRTNRNRRRR